ncbi:MAG: hypothetical protein LBF75_00160 [Treponema sp.]|jgi:hypothetical protein|nr:hypothetical protein [Treponema sp.]
MRKKIGSLLWMLFVFFIASCDFEIPESLTVTGNPGVHIPLGSPFGASGKSINDYIGREKIQGMINPSDESGTGSDNKVVLYDYQGTGTDNLEVQTYLVRYEIAKLNLDLEKHIQEADDITVPPLVIPAIPGSPGTFSTVYITKSGISSNQPSEPLFEISLGAIEKWMKDVKLDKAGITIQGGAGLENTLKLKIPQLGIADYSKGTPESNGDLKFTGNGYTLFTTTGTDAEQKASKKIEIYAQLVGPPQDGTYQMELNFEWTEATLNPGTDGKFTGTYTVDFGDFTKYLGNARLKTVPAYIFIHGLPNDAKAKMTLTDLVTDESITSASLSAGFFNDQTSTATGPIPSSSINEAIDLVNLFTTSSSALAYTITVQSVTITPQSNNQTITAEMLIKIPLEFEVTGETVTVEGTSYKELQLEPLQGLTGSDNDGDLFGRTGKEDDLLKGIEEVELDFYKYTNTIIEGLSLFVGKPDGSGSFEGELLTLGRDTPNPLRFTGPDVEYPFNPQFKVLVGSNNTNSYSFKIGRLNEGAKLDFSLILEASAQIDQTINF